jgi:hypothetical protein
MWSRGWGFLYQRFSSLSATKPIRSETNKAEPRSNGDHSSILVYVHADIFSAGHKGVPLLERLRTAAPLLCGCDFVGDFAVAIEELNNRHAIGVDAQDEAIASVGILDA